MAKGSVRKKGKKWYYRFYVEDASGNSVQREFPGSESKSETEAMLRKAMADYEEKQFVAKSENLTLAGLLDKWIEEELKPGSLSNGTVAAYIDTARRIKKHPIADRKLKKITPDHLQSYLDLLSLGGEWPDGRYESPATVSNVCRVAKKRVDGMESFHFHQLRHTFTSNLLSYGAAPKDVQELLGHSDVATTMNIYAHASREAKRDAAKLLDKVQ